MRDNCPKMKKVIKVCLVQPLMVWENIDANLELIEGMLNEEGEGVDLIILPETFSTGFTMRSELFADHMDGEAVRWMKKVASERNTHIAGSIIIMEEGRIYNRLLWVSPEGVEDFYDKRHLFRMGREYDNYYPGDARKVFILGDFRFLPQVCYDLRFPVFSRNRDDYDVIFYVANWPAPRQNVWEVLTRARAMENQAYLLGVNRVGQDGQGVDHLGGTCAVDPLGNIIGSLDHNPGIMNCTLSFEVVQKYREKFPAWKDADSFTLE